jgi:hypothetical protein
MRIMSRCHPRTSHASLCLDRRIDNKEFLDAQEEEIRFKITSQTWVDLEGEA